MQEGVPEEDDASNDPEDPVDSFGLQGDSIDGWAQFDSHSILGVVISDVPPAGSSCSEICIYAMLNKLWFWPQQTIFNITINLNLPYLKRILDIKSLPQSELVDGLQRDVFDIIIK